MTVLEVKHQGKMKEWQERIIECRSSGEPVKTWCREQGISVTTYYRWEREIFGRVGREKGGEVRMAAGAPVFAEVPALEAGSRGGGTEPKIRVHTGGMSMDIYVGADTEMIQTIIRALRSC